MRTKTVVKSNTQRSIVSKYNKGMGLIALGEEFGLSPAIIRRVLVENDVTIRPVGRPKQLAAV